MADFLNWKQAIYKTWPQNYTRMLTELSGSDWTITNILKLHFTCPRNIANWHSVKCSIYQFGGHNAALKTYIHLTSSYFWPKIYLEVLKHTKTCLCCQQRKMSAAKPSLLQPLSMLDQPNIRVYAGPALYQSPR